jgi:hypothetical protein
MARTHHAEGPDFHICVLDHIQDLMLDITLGDRGLP